MKTKTILILLCLVTQVLQTNGLIQLKNSLVHSDSPLLKKILELVDAAVNDEHLLQVTLKLLRSLCICMRETLKTKEVNLNIGNYPLDLNESSGTQGKVFELYKNIYNNTCFNLRQDLTNRTYKFIVDEEAEFLNHTNCGKDEKNETIVERDDSDKSSAVKYLTTSRLEQVLFKALIQTKDLHEYRLRKYNLFGKGTPQLKKALQHILIVILTLHPDKQELSSRRHNIEEKDLNNTLYTKSPIDVDIISTEHDQTRKDQAIKAEICSECNLQSLYIYLTESDRNNQIKVFKLIRKRDTIKIYTEVKVKQNHTDLINICCKNGTTIPQCNREILNDFMTQPKLIDENYKNTITKIRSLVNQYEHKLNDTTHHNISTTVQDEKREENFIKESTTKQSGANADRINNIPVSATKSKESSKLDEVTQAIVLLNDFVSKQTTKTYSQTHQTDPFKPWTEFMLKEEIQQEITTPYNSIDIGTTLDVKGQEEKSHHTSISSLPIFENNRPAKIKNDAPENIVITTTMFKEYETSNNKENNESLGVTLPVSQRKHETEEELRQATISKTETVYMLNKPYTIESSSINNNVNTDLYKKLLEFITPQLNTAKTLIPDLGINKNDYETYLLRQHIIKVSDSSSTTASATEQSTETILHYSPSLNLVNLANNTTLSTAAAAAAMSTTVYNNSLYSIEQTFNDAQIISETSILVNSPNVTKSIAESELMNETFATEQSKASVSNAIPNVTSTNELTKNVNEIGQYFTLGESILDDVVKPKETKTFTSDSLPIKYLSETTIKSTFRNIAPNTTFKPVTIPESYKQSVPGHKEDVITIDIVTKTEPTSKIAFYVTVEKPNEKNGTKTVMPESLETNKISETTFQNVAINTKPFVESLTTLDDMEQLFLDEKTTTKPTFKDIATNTTLESLITLYTLDFIQSHNQSGNSDMEGINITDRVTKAETMRPFASHVMNDAPTALTDTKMFTSEYLETNKISETTMKTITNTTFELLTKLSMLDLTNSQNQSVIDNVEGINITDTVSKEKSTSLFASHIMVNAPHEQTETKTSNITETTIQNVAMNTKPESLTTVNFQKSYNQSFFDDMGGTNIIDRVRVTTAKPMSTINTQVQIDELNEQTETKIFTLESLETNTISETKLKTKFKDIATNTTLESLTALSTIDFTKSHKQSIYDDIEEIETTDIITKAEPMSTFASQIIVEAPNEQRKTKTSPSEFLVTSNISETTVKTTFWNVTTNTAPELLTKPYNQSIYDDIEGLNTIDRIIKAGPLNTFASDVLTLDDVVYQEKTKTFTSESPETNTIFETTMERTFQNIATNMTDVEPFTSLPTLDTTTSDNQAVYDDIEGIHTTTKAELMHFNGSHVMVKEPVNPTGQQLRTNVTKNGIKKISTIERTFSKSTEDLNNIYNGMNFDMLDDLFEEGEPNNHTNAGTETNEYKTHEKSHMTTGVPMNTEEINTIDTDNEITIKRTDALTSEIELQMTTEFFKIEYIKVNSTFPATINTNPGTDTNTRSYKTTALSVDTKETTVNTQDIVSTSLQNITDKEITMRSTNTVTPEQELRMTTEFNKEEPYKLNTTFPGIISTQSVPSTELILQSEIVSTYSANLPKSRDTVDKQNQTELFYSAISTEPYSETVREAYTTLIPTLIIKHSVTTGNLQISTSDDIQNTESVDIHTVYDTADITCFDNDYEVANNLARPEILSAKTNTRSEALVMERNENNLKSEAVNIKENNNLENRSIFIEATTGFDKSLSSEILDIMNLTTKISFTKHTLPLELEKDILRKQLETEDNVTLNDTFVITTYSGIEGLSDAPSRNVSKALPQKELVINKLFHKNEIFISNTSLEERKNLSSEHSLSAKINEEDYLKKKNEIHTSTSTNSEMERLSDKLLENKIKVPKNYSESLAQEESVVNRLLDKEVSLLFYTSPEETFTSNLSEISLDTHAESVQKGGNNGLKIHLNSIIESSSPYLSTTEITTDLPEFTREYTTIIANISADELLAENNATFIHKELCTMPESGTSRPSKDTFTVALNSTIFFTQELNDTVDMEVPTLGIIAQQDQTDVSLTMPTFIIAVGSSLDSMAQSTLKHEDMKKVSVPGIRTKNHENILDDIIITDELISSPTHTETTKKDESRNEDFDYFGNDGTTLTLENESSTKNTALHEKQIPDPSTSAIITTTERSTLKTLILKNLSSSQTIIQNNTEHLITTESESEIIDMKNDTNVKNIIESGLFTPESVISDLTLSTPATLSSTEVMQDTTINKQQTTSVMRIKESTLFNIESVISALRLSTPSTLSSTLIVQNTTINKQLTTSDMRTKEATLFTTESVNSDLRLSTSVPLSSMKKVQNTTTSKQLTKSAMNIKQILESPYIGTTEHTFIEAWQTTQVDEGSYATIAGPKFGANEETKTENLAQLNDILAHITTQQTNFMTQPVYKDYTFFEEETKSSIEPTPRELPKSISTFTQTNNKNYTKEANFKRSKSLKRKIKTKKPIAFELSIRVGVEANKDGIKFSVLDEKETVIHEKPELRLPETILLNLNQSADNDIQDTLLRSEIKFANETVNNNTTSLRDKIKDIDLNNTIRRCHNIENEDLCRITEILKKLSWNTRAKTRKKNPKRMKTRKSFAGNTTINEEIQLNQVNTSSYNATTPSTHKKFTSIKHKSIMPGALTEQNVITNITSIYKEHFEKIKDFMNNTKNGNKSATDGLKKTHEAMLTLPVIGNIENMRLYTTRVNNTLHDDQEDLEVGSRTLGSAKNYSVKSEPTLNKNETSKTSKLIYKKNEIMLKKLLEGKKLSKRQLRKFKRKLLKKLTSKKNITSVHKFHDIVEKKVDVNTTINKYTTIQGDNGTEIQNMEVFTSSSLYSEKPNTKIVLLVNNKTQSEEKISKEIDKQAAVVVILNTTSKGILQGGRRLFDTHSNKSLSHEIEQESSKFKPETIYQNTSTETNISFSKVAAITSIEEAHLSEIILKEIDEDMSKPENESLKDTSETLNEVPLNSSDALTKTETKEETLSLFDSHYSDLLEELKVVSTHQDNNKALSNSRVNSTSTIVTDANNTTDITNTKSNNSATRYKISKKTITSPFQTTLGFYGTTTPFLNTEFEIVGQNKFSSDKEDLKYTVPITTVKSNTFDDSEIRSDDNAATVNFPLTSSILTIINVPPLISKPNANITKTKHHYIIDDIINEIPDQSSKPSEFVFKEDYRRAENLEIVTSKQQNNDVSNTLLPPTGAKLSFTRRIKILTDTNHNKYEGFETTASKPSTSVTINNNQDIILTSPSEFDILTTYYNPDAQSSIISMYQQSITDFPVKGKSLDMEKRRNINDGYLSVDKLKSFNAKSMTNSGMIDYSSTSLNYKELKSTEQIFSDTLDKEMYKQKQYRNKKISKEITNKANYYTKAHQAITTQHPIEEYFIDFADDETESQHSFNSTLGTGKYVETTSNILDVSLTKLSLTQIPSKILKTEKETEGYDIQIRKATNNNNSATSTATVSTGLTLTSQIGNMSSMIPESLSDTHTKQTVLNQNIVNKENGTSVNYETFVDNVTETIKISSDSSPITTQYIITVIDDVNGFTNVSSDRASKHGDKTSSIEVREHEKNLENKTQLFYVVDKYVNVTSTERKNITNSRKTIGSQSNYKSVFPNVGSMEYTENIRRRNINDKISKMEIFSSRLNRPHKVLFTTTTACTKNIKYNTYRPITKEELEILKYFSDPILSTVLHKQVDDKPHSQVPAFNHSNASIMESSNNILQSESTTIIRANNSEDKRMIHAKNQDRGDKDLHLTLTAHKNLNQSIEIDKNPHSSEINRISHPILEININSPQIRNNGNSPPMIEINGNPLPIEINRNSAPLDINRNSGPMGNDGNSAPMGIIGNSAKKENSALVGINGYSATLGMNGYYAPIGITGNSAPMGINENSAPMRINGNSAPMGINGSSGLMGNNRNFAPMGINGNTATISIYGNSAPMGINGNSPPMGFGGNSASMGINGNSAPMGISRNSALMGINGNSAPMGINGYSAPMGINGNSAAMGINGNSAPMGINGNSAPMGNNGNSAPMGINENSAPMGINGNFAPISNNGNSSPMGMKENSAPVGINGYSATLGMNGYYAPIGINGNAAPMGINENSAPMGINGNSVPEGIHGNSAPMGMNENAAPMGVYRNSPPMAMNVNSGTMEMNGNAAPMEMNRNYAPMGINGNSAPMAMNVNSGVMAIYGNSAQMGINENSAPKRMNGKYVPKGMNGNSLIFDITRNPVPMGINGNSLMMEITRNSARIGTNGNSVPIRIDGNSMTMNINRNLVPMDISNNPVAIEMKGNPMPVGNNGNSEMRGTHQRPLPIGINGNQVPMGTNENLLSMGNNGNSVPIRMNENSVPLRMNRNSLMIDSTKNPAPMGIHVNSAPMRTSRNSTTMNINGNPVPIELSTNLIPLAINGSTVTMVADRKLEPLGNNGKSMPMNITINSVQMGINGNSVPTKIENNATSVPMQVNKTSVPSEINRNPAPMEATRNQVLMDINRNSLLMELSRSLIPQKNNRDFIPPETNNNSNSKESNRDLPRILETNRNTSPTPNLNRNTLSVMNSSSYTGNNLKLSPTNDKNRSTLSMDENNKNVFIDNENLSSTTNKPWISASMFNNNRNSHATIDNNSNLQIFHKDQNSLLTHNRNKNSPSIIDINRYSLVVNKNNSLSIIHNKWNLPSIMGNNKKAPSVAHTINRHSINENTKTTSASGNNMNAHSVIDDNEKSSKNIDTKKSKPSGTRDQGNNKNSLPVVANVSFSPPTVNLHSSSTTETNNKSPSVNYFNHIVHSTVKTNIISASPTTETKTSEAFVATKKKILPMKEIKRKPFLTFKSNKKPPSITGKKINTHAPLQINRNLLSKIVTKNFKRISSQKATLLHSFENINTYAKKIKEPSVQREIKEMKMGARRKAVKTINTQDFILQHRYVTPRSVLQKTTKPYSTFLKPQRLILKSKTLRPIFDSIDRPAKRLASKMKRKLLLKKRRSGRNFQRMVPKRARVNNVDMPIWHTTLKPKFLKDRDDAMNFMFDDNYIKIMKMTRRPAVTDDLRFFGNNYNPSPSFRRNNMEQPTTESGRKRQQGRTIFFLSPTEFYDQYKDFE